MKITAIVAALACSTTFVAAAEMGDVDAPIKLAVNEWTGQHLSTHIAGQILEQAGYKVEYTTAGYYNMWQGMADGDVHAALEVWSSNVPDTFGELEKAGSVVDLGDLGLDAKEGIAYPAHVAELCPGLPAWEALKDCAMQFATAETLPQGRLLDYPADWGTPGADRLTGLELPFKAIPAGSEGALITELRASVERKTPLLIVFWQPHWAMAAYDVQFVDLPAGEAACFDDPAWGVNPNATSDCDFTPTRVYKTAWAGLEAKWPAAAEILKGYQFAVEDQQPLMALVDVDGKSVEEVAASYVADHADTISALIASATN